MNNIAGNAFSVINVTMQGYRDTQYLAGGGVIGLRATGEGVLSASASIGTITGNLFNDVTVITKQHTSGTGSAYIEGGSIIGVDAVSTPNSISGHASIDNLTNNFFTNVTVDTGDILLGGGLIGLNNNSQTNSSSDTYVELQNVDRNIFNGDINVTVGASLRGGGVIGLNGLSNAKADLLSLTNNVFVGIRVSAGSYLRGGGVVGIQINDVEGKPDFSPVPGDTNVAAFLGRAANNIFLDINVESGADPTASSSVGSNMEGGGIIGVRSNQGEAAIGTLEDNTFKNLGITVSTITSPNTENNLGGGGVVGVSSHQTAIIGEVYRNVFDEITVDVDGNLRGGGIIGVDAENNNGLASDEKGAYIGYLTGNTFGSSANPTIITVKGNTPDGGIFGGGVVGGYTVQGLAGAVDIVNNSFAALRVITTGGTSGNIFGGGLIGFSTVNGNVSITNVASNKLSGNIITAESITGGGLIGLAAADSASSTTVGSTYLSDVNNNSFTGGQISTTGAIRGGGVVGLYSDEENAAIEHVEGNTFDNLRVDADGAITGGGLIGVNTGTAGVADTLTYIEVMKGNRFTGGSITAASITGGGVIGVNAENGGGIAFLDSVENSVFNGLNVTTTGTGNIEGGGVIGVRTNDDDAVIGSITGSGFESIRVTAGGHIGGGGIIGVTGEKTNDIAAGIGLIDSSYFRGNNVTANDGRIMGGLVYSYGLLGDGLTINNSQFTDNILTSAYSGAGGAKVYGAVTVDTGLPAVDALLHTLTLSAANKESTIFKNNQIIETGINPNPRYNSLYFGSVLTVNNGSDNPVADAALVIDAKAGGVVELYDPIKVDQTEGGSGIKTFNMTVKGGGGDFKWGGYNEFAIDDSATKGAITLESGSNTTLMGGYQVANDDEYDTDHETFSLSALNFDFNLKSGGTMQVNGSNVMTLNSAVFSGELKFNLDGTDWMLQSDANDTSINNYFLLTVNTDPAQVTNIEGATVSLMPFGRGSDATLPSGNFVFPLIATDDDGKLVGNPANSTAYGYNEGVYARQGLTRGYTFNVDKLGPEVNQQLKYLYAYNPLVGASRESRVLVEGRAAGLGFLRAAWLPDHSYQQADLALYQEGSYKSWVPFAGIDGAWLRTDTGGGRYEVSGVNGLLGIARENKKPGESLLTGLFVEAGYGEYDTFNTIHYAPYYLDMRGDGTLRFVGAGIMARKEWSNGVRLEGSFRAGRIKNEFKSDDFIDPETESVAAYDSSTPYYAAHVGLARAWMINDHRRFDLIGRYFWTRQDGEAAVLPNGEIVHFGTDDSHRVRLGGRMTFIKDVRREWYLGVAGEYEFGGGISASTVHGYAIDSPSLDGFTGIGELGWIWRSTKDKDFSFETGLQGYLGRMRGISGGIRMEWRF